VDQASVFKVCDQPHPKLVKEILAACLDGNIHDSHSKLEKLWAKGYSAGDIVQVPSHCFFCAILCDAREHARWGERSSLPLPFCLSPFLPPSCFLRVSPFLPLLALSAYTRRDSKFVTSTNLVCAGHELRVTPATRVTLTRPAPIHTRKQTFSRVTGNMDMPEKSKLDFLKIVGEYHMRVLEGADTLVQLSGMLAKMCLLKHNVAPCA
jgi:hypothetical protein